MKISLLIIALGLAIAPQSIDKKTQKKIDKEVEKVFHIKEYDLDDFPIHKDKEIRGDFFVIKSIDTLGYCYVGSVLEHSTYFILFNKEKEIQKVKISNFNDDYGQEICSRSWLKQFIGHKGKKKLQMGKDIDAVSGATITSEEMIYDVSAASRTLNIE
ncbi:MAG: FMN-binding protein [Marinifilaceae bacterium]